MRRTQQKVVFIISALVLLSLVLWSGLFVRKQHALADRQRCAAQLIAIGQAIFLYCNENRGNLPPSFRELMLTQDISSEIFICSASRDTPAAGDDLEAKARQLTVSGHCSYRYLGSGNMRDLTPDIVLAVEKASHHGGDLEINVLFGNGQVRHMAGAASKQILDAIARAERPVRYSGKEGQVMRKSGN